MDEGIQAEVAHAHDTEEQPRKRTRLSSQLVREVGLMRNVPGDSHPGFVGSASGIFFIRSVYAALRRSQASVPFQGETPGSEVVPGEDDHITSIVPGGSHTLWRSGELQTATANVVTFEELVEWTGSFFANWHPFFPFLHAPTILQYFEVLSHEGISHEDSSFNLEIVIIKSAVSISLADRRQAGQGNLQVPSNLIFKSYEAAIDSLHHVFSEPTSELGLQAAISVQLFLVSMLRLNAASRLGGLINRMAAQLGLHRCPARYSTFASNEKDIRRRIFWSLYAIDRFICQSMGLPLGLNDDDIDVCFPFRENHLAERMQQTADTKLALMGFLARQSRLRGDIIELRNKSLQYVQKNPDQAISIGAQLTQWWNDIEEYSDAEGNGTLSRYHMTILTLLKHESVISLHRPVLAAAQKGPAYDAALQLCIGSARSIITTLHKAISGSNTSMALLWPSCTWAVWISTFILFYAANSKHLSSDIVARLADRSLEILQHLARRGSAWPEASAAAIRDLRMKLMNPERATFRDGNESQYHTHDDLPAPTAGAPEATTAGQSSDPQNADYGLPRENWNEVSGHEKAPLAHSEATAVPEFITSIQPANTFDPEHNSNVSFDTAFINNPSSGFEDILQNLGDGNDVTSHNSLDPFSGFDIPFWFDQDQQWDIFQDFN